MSDFLLLLALAAVLGFLLGLWAGVHIGWFSCSRYVSKELEKFEVENDK